MPKRCLSLQTGTLRIKLFNLKGSLIISRVYNIPWIYLILDLSVYCISIHITVKNRTDISNNDLKGNLFSTCLTHEDE